MNENKKTDSEKRDNDYSYLFENQKLRKYVSRKAKNTGDPVDERVYREKLELNSRKLFKFYLKRNKI